MPGLRPASTRSVSPITCGPRGHSGHSPATCACRQTPLGGANAATPYAVRRRVSGDSDSREAAGSPSLPRGGGRAARGLRARSRGWTRAGRARRVGATAGPRDRSAPRRALVGARAHRHGSWLAGAALLHALFSRLRGGPRPVLRHPARFRGSDVRSRARGRRVLVVRALGGDQRLLLPPHRSLHRQEGEPKRRAPGLARHHDRRAGDACRPRDSRGADRHLQYFGHHRRRTARNPCDGRRHARARRGAVEVGDLPVPLLASRSDGRAHPRQRLPARGCDGQGGHLSGCPVRPRLRRDARMARGDRRARRHHHAARRLGCPSPDRSETPARLRHCQPTRLSHGCGRLWLAHRRARRSGARARARALQVDALLGGWHHRPRHRHARPAQTLRTRPLGPRARGRCSDRPGVDGRAAAAARIRR